MSLKTRSAVHERATDVKQLQVNSERVVAGSSLGWMAEWWRSMEHKALHRYMHQFLGAQVQRRRDLRVRRVRDPQSSGLRVNGMDGGDGPGAARTAELVEVSG